MISPDMLAPMMEFVSPKTLKKAQDDIPLNMSKDYYIGVCDAYAEVMNLWAVNDDDDVSVDTFISMTSRIVCLSNIINGFNPSNS